MCKYGNLTWSVWVTVFFKVTLWAREDREGREKREFNWKSTAICRCCRRSCKMHEHANAASWVSTKCVNLCISVPVCERDTHQALCVAVLQWAPRVAVAIVLTVDYTTFHSLLYLKIICTCLSITQSGSQSVWCVFCNGCMCMQNVCIAPHLSTQDAVHHDDDEALERVEDGKEDLEESRAPVCDGQHGRHPSQSQ